jgi:hypothetical protein
MCAVRSVHTGNPFSHRPSTRNICACMRGCGRCDQPTWSPTLSKQNARGHNARYAHIQIMQRFRVGSVLKVQQQNAVEERRVARPQHTRSMRDAHTHTHAHAHAHARTDARTHTRTQTQTQTHARTHAHTHTYVSCYARTTATAGDATSRVNAATPIPKQR